MSPQDKRNLDRLIERTANFNTPMGIALSFGIIIDWTYWDEPTKGSPKHLRGK